MSLIYLKNLIQEKVYLYDKSKTTLVRNPKNIKFLIENYAQKKMGQVKDATNMANF